MWSTRDFELCISLQDKIVDKDVFIALSRIKRNFYNELSDSFLLKYISLIKEL